MCVCVFFLRSFTLLYILRYRTRQKKRIESAILSCCSMSNFEACSARLVLQSCQASMQSAYQGVTGLNFSRIHVLSDTLVSSGQQLTAA